MPRRRSVDRGLGHGAIQTHRRRPSDGVCPSLRFGTCLPHASRTRCPFHRDAWRRRIVAPRVRLGSRSSALKSHVSPLPGTDPKGWSSGEGQGVRAVCIPKNGCPYSSRSLTPYRCKKRRTTSEALFDINFGKNFPFRQKIFHPEEFFSSSLSIG